MNENINFYDTLEYREFKTKEFKRGLMCEYIFYMLDKTIPMFKWGNLPDTIPSRKLEEYIQTRGYVGVKDVNNNLYALTGGRGGERDAYYEPTKFVVANPYLDISGDYEIGVECEIIRNDALYIGLMPMFTRYASLLTENAITLRLTDINLRSIFTMGAPDDKTKASAELYLDRLEDGYNAVIGETAFFDGISYNDTKNTSNRMKDLIEYEQYLKASWFNELGLDSNYNMKRERISESEVNQNSDALIPLILNMLNERREGAERVNKMFGTNITVDFDSVWLQNFKQSNEDISERLENEYKTLVGGGEDETNKTE